MNGKVKLEPPQLERRHLTVLECDLVGSTALANKLDPEELRDLVLAYQDCVLTWVRKMNGFFVQFAGDAIWAYFGYPHAHEDDACQAIRAGLAITKAVSAIHLYGETLSVRIGIASGLCVVGNMRLSTSSENMDNQITALGNPPNLAARLQTLVEPGSIAVSEETRSLAGNLFNFEDLGFRKIKGFKDETKVWRVLGEINEQNRFRALRPKIRSPLVGRKNELLTLTNLWKATCLENGKVVFLSGEPGIGKSRLIASLAESVISLGNVQWWFHCGEYLQGSAFAPIITQIQTLAGFSNIDDTNNRVDKIRKTYSYLNDKQLGLLSELLLIEDENKLIAPATSASKRRENLYEVLIKMIKEQSKITPMLVVVEDIHWTDPSTLEFIQRLALCLDKIPVLLVISSRDLNSFRTPAFAYSHIHNINIKQLKRNDCFELLESLWEKDDLPLQLSEQIVDQTDGVPLFIEDVIFSLHQSTQEYSGSLENKKITVPTKLSEHLMSRIDDLGESKQVAQLAAVIGREFSLSMLQALSNLTASKLEKRINRLIDSGLILLSDQIGERRYIFKHAMVRDAAYESLLISDRMELHSRIASWIEKERPAQRQTQPETIAYHYEMAGAFDLAVKHWLQAGQYSNSRSNYIEAIIQLNNAYRLTQDLTSSPERNRFELEIVIALGVASAGAGGISGEDTGNIYSKALSLCEALDFPDETFPVLAGAGSLHFIRSNYKTSLDIADQSIRLAKKKSNSTGLVIGKRIIGAVQCVTGNFVGANKSLSNAICVYDKNPEFHRSYSLTYALDHKTTALCYLGLANIAVSKIDSALNVSQQAVEHSESIDLHSKNCALCYQAAIRHLRNDTAELILKVATHSLELALDEGYASWIGMSRLLQGEAIIQLGKIEEGMINIEKGVLEHADVMAQTFLPLAQSVLAKGYMATNQYEQSINVLIEAESLSIQTEQYWYLPEVQRLHAEALIGLEQYEAAYNYYIKSWASAGEIGANFWQLKIAFSMADNKSFANTYNDAYTLLAEAARSIKEGHEEPFVIKAFDLIKKNTFHTDFK